MKFTVEAIEDGIAILENIYGEKIEISVDNLPDGIKEGSILTSIDDDFKILIEDTRERRRMMFEKQRRLLGDRKN